MDEGKLVSDVYGVKGGLKRELVGGKRKGGVVRKRRMILGGT